MSNNINKFQAIAVLVPFGKIAWVERNNKRKDYGDTNTIRNSLAERGWMVDNPVPVCTIDDSELATTMENLNTEYTRLKDALKASDTLANRAELAVFEQLHTEEIDGVRSVIKPEYSGNAGFRRARSFRGAMVQRYTAKPSKENPTPETNVLPMIPARVTEYASRADRVMDQQLENELQGVGTKKMDDLEKLAVTKELFDAGCFEVQIRKLYSSSTGQKCYGICQIDANYPELAIYRRFTATPTDHADFIPWGPVRGAELVKLNGRFEADRKRNEGLPLNNSERPLEPITAEEVDLYFRDKAKSVTGDGNAAKIMQKKDMEGGSKNHKLLPVRAVFDSVLGNTQANLSKMMEHPDAINGVWETVKSGKGKDADAVFNAYKSSPALMVALASLILTGKTADVQKVYDTLTAPPVSGDATAPADANGSGKKSGKGNKQPA